MTLPVRRSVAAVAIALVAAMTLAACGSSGSTAGSGSASGSASAGSSGAAPSSAAASSSGSASSGAPSSAASSSAGSPSSTGGSASPAANPGSGSFFTTVQAADKATLDAVAADPTLQGQLPAAVKSAGVLKIGTQISAPENFYSPGTTNLIGDEATLMRAIAKTLGLTAQFQVVQFDELIPGLTSKRFDLTIGAMNDTKKRQATITFVDYFNAGIGIVVKKGNPKNVTSPESFCGLAVNVQLGTTQEALAKQQSTSCQAAGKKPVTIVYAKNNGQQEAELQSGRVDVYLADSPTAAYVAAQHPDEFQQADASTAIQAAPYGIGFNQGSTALVKAVQGALNKLISDGSYGKIMATWGLQSGALTTATVNGGK